MKNYYSLCRKLMVFHMVLIFFCGIHYSMEICDAIVTTDEVIRRTILYIISVITNIWAVICEGDLMCREKEQDEIEEN